MAETHVSSASNHAAGLSSAPLREMQLLGVSFPTDGRAAAAATETLVALAAQVRGESASAQLALEAAIQRVFHVILHWISTGDRESISTFLTHVGTAIPGKRNLPLETLAAVQVRAASALAKMSLQTSNRASVMAVFETSRRKEWKTYFAKICRVPGGFGPTDLMRAVPNLGRSNSYVFFNHLERAGLVRRREGRDAIYDLTPDGREAARILDFPLEASERRRTTLASTIPIRLDEATRTELKLELAPLQRAVRRYHAGGGGFGRVNRRSAAVKSNR